MAESGKSEDTVIDVFKQNHKYKGVTLSVVQTPEIYDSLHKWETRPDDVYVVSFPKSGTHCIYEIALLIMNDLDVERIVRSRMPFGLDLVLAQSLDGIENGLTGPEVMAKWTSPRVILTHLLEQFAPDQIRKSSKVLYCARNPKDVAVSWFEFLGTTLPAELEGWKGFVPHFLSDDSKQHDSFDESEGGLHTAPIWTKMPVMAGGWFRHVKGWFARQNDPNVLICKYEDLSKDLSGSIKRIADFLGRSLSDDQLDKLVALTEMQGMRKTYQHIEDTMGDRGKAGTRFFGKMPYLRRGKVGGWKERFTVAQSEFFDGVYKEEMEGTSIEFDFEL